jgi:hypothetical protein
MALVFSLLAGPASAVSTVRLRLSDGFDFPVGRPNATGYQKARGFWPNGHLGEDWNGRGGGNTDLGDPVYSCADGIVVHSRDVRVGWGNVVIIRHVYRETDGSVKVIDSLYGHLNDRFVTLNQRVKRGQKIGTIGTNHGMYVAHLHFEIRKNLNIGMNRSSFDRTLNSYHDPTKFINAHRSLGASSRDYAVPINTFAPYGQKLPDNARISPSANLGSAPKGAPSRSIPVDESRREEIRRIVATATKPEWTPPSDSNRTPTRSSSTLRTTRELQPDVRKIVADTKRTTPSSSGSRSAPSTQSQSTPKETQKSGFWSRFKSKFRSNDGDSSIPGRKLRH